VRNLMWFTAGFGAVCMFAGYHYGLTLLLWACLCFALASVGCFFLRNRRILRVLSVVFLGCSLGCGWFLSYDGLYLSHVRDLDSNTCDMEFYATDYSWETDYGIGMEGFVRYEGKRYRVIAYLDEAESIKPGDCVTGSFRVRFTTHGAKSEAISSRGDGIVLILYQAGEAAVSHAEELPWHGYPAYWRQVLLGFLGEVFPEDVSGFARALLLGVRDGLDYETQTALKVSGIQHIVAVSGLHVSILCGLLYVVTLRKRFLTFFLGIPLLFLFAAVVGFSPSVTRACIMHGLMLLAQLIEREYDPPTELAFSVLVMLLINPLVVVSVSFQLSVACVIGILLFFGRIKAWFANPTRIGTLVGKGLVATAKRWFVNSVSITLSTSVTTTPLVAYYFGMVSLVSVLTNLLTLWAVTVIFYGIVVVCLLGFASTGIASFVAGVMAWGIRYVLCIAKGLAKLPFAAVYTESIYTVIWLVGCYLLLAVFQFMRYKRPVLLMYCTALCFVLSVAASWTEPLLYDCYVTVLDVGQGQCVILQSGGQTFVVDCGGSYAEGAGDLAAETLLSRGIGRIDGLILTHYDEDHAGGAQYLLDRIETDAMFLPELADENGVAEQLTQKQDAEIIRVGTDTEILFDGGKIALIAPIDYNSGNESSLCVLFQTEKCDILITGDRGELGEMLLLHNADLPKLEVLVVGHHGAASSTTRELLAAVQPEIAVISVGADNPYGHPAQSVLDRLADCGCEIYRTDQNGTIIFRR